MLAIRTSSDPITAARVTADLHGLPTGRLIARDTAAHIFTADVYELRAWINALGGFVTRQRAGGAVTLWTLHTHTEPRSDGSTTAVLVHALSLADEDIHPDITEAVA
ncbi:hypothetical protein [Streptomyces sp. NPDC007074]|uniref:hypothetical protein n=1 Tax=Streptomyces sp. NPDC007074 TaxID=3156764 RepID=UPI0033ED803D